MQTAGAYIKNRLLPGFVRAACKELAIPCQAFSDDWVLQLKSADGFYYVVGYKFDLNQAAAGALAADKVAAYQVLQAAGVPAVEHQLFRGGDMPSVSNIHGGVVIKPLTGTGGRQVVYFATVKAAHDYMQQSAEEAWAISPYVKITREIRTIVLDGEPLLMYEKIPDLTSGTMVLFNLGKGATPVDLDVHEHTQTLALAIRAQQALGLRVAAVDCIELADGTVQVLEVNDGIMMEYYARVSADHYTRAQEVYTRIINASVGLSLKKNPHVT